MRNLHTSAINGGVIRRSEKQNYLTPSFRAETAHQDRETKQPK